MGYSIKVNLFTLYPPEYIVSHKCKKFTTNLWEGYSMNKKIVIVLLMLLVLSFNIISANADTNTNIENNLLKKPIILLQVKNGVNLNLLYMYDYEYDTLVTMHHDNHIYVDFEDFAKLLQQSEALTTDRTYKLYQVANEIVIDEYVTDYSKGTVKLNKSYTPSCWFNGISERLFIPLRATFEELGFKVEYVDDKKFVVISKDYTWNDDIKALTINPSASKDNVKPVVQDESIVKQLIDEGYPAWSVMGEKLNTEVYTKYGVIAYGSEHGKVDKTGEYEFLGYSWEQIELKNYKYDDSDPETNPVDFQIEMLPEYNWCKYAGPSDFMNMATVEMRDNILKSKVIFKGKELDLTLPDILKNFTKDTTRYMNIINMPSKAAYGVVYMKHEWNGEVITEVFLLPKLK